MYAHCMDWKLKLPIMWSPGPANVTSHGNSRRASLKIYASLLPRDGKSCELQSLNFHLSATILGLQQYPTASLRSLLV